MSRSPRTRLLFAAIITLAISHAALADPGMRPDVGDEAPDIQLKDQDGQLVRLSDLWQEQAVVVFFYPRDFTPNCTQEAIGFRDHIDEFEGMGIQVVGVSIDTVGTHRRFADRYDLPYALLADIGGRAAGKFGVCSAFYGFDNADRVTFLIDRGGAIAAVFEEVYPKTHALDVLAEAIQLDVVYAPDPLAVADGLRTR